MCGQNNVRASAENNTGQNIDKGHTPNPRTEIKIPDTAGNRTRAAGNRTQAAGFGMQSLSGPRHDDGEYFPHLEIMCLDCFLPVHSRGCSHNVSTQMTAYKFNP